MPTGTVKWFDPDKGYGFIQPDDEVKDIFVDIAAVQSSGLQRLNERQRLRFEVETGYGKKLAVRLRPL
jgi:cold shock protein